MPEYPVGRGSSIPSLTSQHHRHCERQRSHPVAPQQDGWIASALSLLAMTGNKPAPITAVIPAQGRIQYAAAYRFHH